MISPFFAPMTAVATWLYVSACVVAPLAWGVATELLFRWLGRRRPTRPDESELDLIIDNPD